MRSSFGRFVMLRKNMPELLGRCEIGLPSAGAITNKLNAKHMYTRGFVLVYLSDRSVKNTDCSR